jgi:hypothetical protein
MNATTVAVDLAKSVFQLAAADAAALLEAARASDIRPVRIKSVEQQALQGLHRIRSLWMGTRTARINALRGFFREFGIAIPVGARTGLEAISRVLADPGSAVLELIRGTARLLVEEVRLLEARIAQLERELAAMARLSPACTTLLSIPGIGLLTATAMVAATSGDVSHFKDARHFASWFGLTSREYSSGNSRYLGSISKRGDRSTCACCSPTEPGACCARPRWPAPRAMNPRACATGLWPCRAAPITTRPPVRWPTRWRAFATPRCVTRCFSSPNSRLARR